MTRVILALSFLFIASCGKADLGESCDGVGSGENCVDNAVCTNASNGAAYCRQICTAQADCPTGYSCNGISGVSTKSCQPD